MEKSILMEELILEEREMEHLDDDGNPLHPHEDEEDGSEI